MPAAIENRQRRVRVETPRVARAAARALAAVGRPSSLVEIALVDDTEIRRLNALGLPRNVPSFPDARS